MSLAEQAAVGTGSRVPGAAVAGVELGGTKCVCVLSDAGGTIIDRRVIPTTQPRETIAAILSVLTGWWSSAPFAALGIASFGPLDLDPGSATFGSITSTTKAGWQAVPVARLLSDPFDVPFAFDTDVNGAALAEGRWGAARGLSDFAYITVGTGVGVGLIVHGRPTRGFGHCELGHMRVPRSEGSWPGSCPFHGDCVEGLASGTAIAKRLGHVDTAALSAEHPIWDGVVEALAQLAQVLVLATGPKRILMGGGVISGQPHLLARIEARLGTILAGYVLLPSMEIGKTYIGWPGLGADAGPLGSIVLALSRIESHA